MNMRSSRRCLFTTSINSEMRHFHFVVVQKRKEMYKKSDARAKLLFCSLILCCFCSGYRRVDGCKRLLMFLEKQEEVMQFDVLT